jgi:hypothetical protein
MYCAKLSGLRQTGSKATICSRIAGKPPASRAIFENGLEDSRVQSFLGERRMESATGEDRSLFLTKRAVENRVSAATQKQALNGLVFFLREVAGMEPGDFFGFRARAALTACSL